jgi:uncharacterized protein with gpF-like domain
MKKSRYNETQIITILKTVEAGRLVKDVCREHENRGHENRGQALPFA